MDIRETNPNKSLNITVKVVVLYKDGEPIAYGVGKNGGSEFELIEVDGHIIIFHYFGYFSEMENLEEYINDMNAKHIGNVYYTYNVYDKEVVI